MKFKSRVYADPNFFPATIVKLLIAPHTESVFIYLIFVSASINNNNLWKKLFRVALPSWKRERSEKNFSNSKNLRIEWEHLQWCMFFYSLAVDIIIIVAVVSSHHSKNKKKRIKTKQNNRYQKIFILLLHWLKSSLLNIYNI